MRQTIALRPPLVSLLRPIFAGCCQPLLRNGPSRRYSANLSLRAWTPTPAASTVLALVSSRETLAFPRCGMRSARLPYPNSYFSWGYHFGAAVIY